MKKNPIPRPIKIPGTILSTKKPIPKPKRIPAGMATPLIP